MEVSLINTSSEACIAGELVLLDDAVLRSIATLKEKGSSCQVTKFLDKTKTSSARVSARVRLGGLDAKGESFRTHLTRPDWNRLGISHQGDKDVFQKNLSLAPMIRTLHLVCKGVPAAYLDAVESTEVSQIRDSFSSRLSALADLPAAARLRALLASFSPVEAVNLPAAPPAFAPGQESLRQLEDAPDHLRALSYTSTLQGLQSIAVRCDSIEDLSVLSCLTGLTALALEAPTPEAPPSDTYVGGIVTLSQLRCLTLGAPALSSLATLSTITGLTRLCFEPLGMDGRIGDVSLLTGLQHLALWGPADPSIDIQGLLEHLLESGTLTGLELADAKLAKKLRVTSTCGLECLLVSAHLDHNISHQCTTLKFLGLMGAIPDALKVMTHLTQLEALSLRGAPLLSQVHLDMIAMMPMLRLLDLQYTEMADEGPGEFLDQLVSIRTVITRQGKRCAEDDEPDAQEQARLLAVETFWQHHWAATQQNVHIVEDSNVTQSASAAHDSNTVQLDLNDDCGEVNSLPSIGNAV